MPRHGSLTDRYIAQLNLRFHLASRWVSAAPDWPETKNRMAMGTYPPLVALDRVGQGWAQEEIESELEVRKVSYRLDQPLP